MIYILLIISITFSALNNITLHFLHVKNVKYNSFLFNAGVTLIWFFILLAYNKGFGKITTHTVIYGVSYGCALVGFLYFKTKLITSVNVSIATLFISSSFIMTTLFNAFFWKERIDFYTVTGIVLMLVSVVLIYIKRVEEKVSFKYKLCLIFAFIFSGLVGIIFRLHQSCDKASTDEMMIISALVATVMLIALYFTTTKKGERKATKDVKPVLTVMLLVGIFSCIYNRLNIYLTGVMESVIFFPTFNGASVLAVFVLGMVLFKEKPTKLQTVGGTLGILAILFTSRFFGLI